MESLRELWEIAQDIWATGDRWGRILICIVFGLPIAFCGLAMLMPNTGVKSGVAFLGLLTLFVLGAWRSPMFIALVSAFSDEGRSFFKWLLTILGIEIVIGVVFAVLDFTKNPGLAPLALLTVSGLVALGTGKVKIKMVSTFLWIVLIGIFAIILFPATKENKDRDQEQSKPASYEIKNGYAARKASVPTQQLVEAETSKKILRKGAYVEIETNCVDYLRDIVSVEPGSTVKIMHLNMDHIPRRNRCAMNLAGDAFPISGNGEDTLPWYKENMLHPEFPAYTLVFILRNTDGIVSENYIRREGGYFLFPNMSGKKAWVDAEYNTPRQTEHREQIGLTGDTATVSFEILE